MRGADIRVLLVSPTFGIYGGMEAFVLAVAEALAGDERFAIRVCFKRTRGFALHPELERACGALPVEFCDRASRGLWRAIRWADVVHGQNASPDVAAMAAVLRKPLALTLHNTLPVRSWVRRLSWRAAAAVATARWYNSRFVWRTWEARRREGSAHLPTISRLPARDVPLAARRGFLFLGRLVPGKGVDVLIEAYGRAGLDADAWPLTIAGDGPMRGALEARCASGVSGVHFTGFIESEAKAAALASARWLVVPSHWQEPLGLVAFEARSVGVPCIVTRDGGLPEAAGDEALVCEPGDADALAELLRRAAGMCHEKYAVRALRTRQALEREVVPASAYSDLYLRLAGADVQAVPAAAGRP